MKPRRNRAKAVRRDARAVLGETLRGRKPGPHIDKRKPIVVTDDDLDAPDGAVVDGYVRIGDAWYPVEE